MSYQNIVNQALGEAAIAKHLHEQSKENEIKEKQLASDTYLGLIKEQQDLYSEGVGISDDILAQGESLEKYNSLEEIAKRSVDEDYSKLSIMRMQQQMGTLNRRKEVFAARVEALKSGVNVNQELFDKYGYNTSNINKLNKKYSKLDKDLGKGVRAANKATKEATK